ncbi:hypothetical protein [Streptomyces sp. NPDC094468]|uniref:hypothetical protein n=1 Tax=Streptomyces sp. NPDC094468 TaxID=3366066 RepID=UPI00382134EF
MPARPEFARPDDAAIRHAMDQANEATAALLYALGDGLHTVNMVVARADGTVVTAHADLFVSSGPTCVAVLDDDEFFALRMLLVFALEGSTVENAVLLATTAAAPRPLVCGWSVRDGWPRPMDTDDVQQAVISCPGETAVERVAYDAPVLPQHRPDTDEETPRG